MLGVTAILLAIFLSVRFVGYLGEVAAGDLPGEVIFKLIALKSLYQLVIVIPLAYYLAVLITLGRMYGDSEMVAMSASGMAPTGILRAILHTAPLIAVIVGVFSFYISPWSEESSARMLDDIRQQSEVSSLAAGQFRETGNGKIVFYIEKLSKDQKHMENVFIQSSRHNTQGVLSAASGYRTISEENGQQYLILENGYRYEGSPGEAEFKIVKFERHGVRIEEKTKVVAKRKRKAIPTTSLFDSAMPADRAELQWRLSMPIAAILLGLLALPVSRGGPRDGRFARLFVGILAYIVYNNLMGVARDMVKAGSVPDLVGMWWVHLLLLLAITAVMVMQTGPRWCLQQLQRRRPSGQPS
jgi:lipopolysaccharide export system permease protein